jgi:hypothetical protein
MRFQDIKTLAIIAQGNEVSRDFDSDEDDTNRITSHLFFPEDIN